MTRSIRLYIISSLVLFLLALAFGILASWAYLYPETYNRFLPFYQLRPFHVSAAIFWILSTATAGILHYKSTVFHTRPLALAEKTFIFSWLVTIIVIFACYAIKIFGGREYWEFPPVICLPLLASWMLLLISYFAPLLRQAGKQPMYVWMWSTGLFFFFITFIEQNLWQISWFRNSYLREVTVQWKANGATVGAWNQMIYGTSLYLMVRISGDERIARGKTVFFFYMLGLSNLMFNWGHHIYNVPTMSWIRDTSYLISMTEWIFLIRIISTFRKTLDERNRLRHIFTYKFIIASEFWVFMNLLLALSMSVPAINRYTHGTHITVAHAMGATIGINTMILMASLSDMLGLDSAGAKVRNSVRINYWITHATLLVFWLSLIVAGIIKGYRMTTMNPSNFREIMNPVIPALQVFSWAGVILAISMGIISATFITLALRLKPKPNYYENPVTNN